MEIIAISGIFLAIGAVVGYLLANIIYKKTTAPRPENRKHPALGDKLSIPSAFDIQVSMVENSCQETKFAEQEKLRTKSRKTARKLVKKVNSYIQEVSEKGNTFVTIYFHTSITDDDAHIICLPKGTALGYVVDILRDAYENRGYVTETDVDVDWRGGIYAVLIIDWSNGISTEHLDSIEFVSQVEAFKSGVPLADIVA